MVCRLGENRSVSLIYSEHNMYTRGATHSDQAHRPPDMIQTLPLLKYSHDCSVYTHYSRISQSRLSRSPDLLHDLAHPHERAPQPCRNVDISFVVTETATALFAFSPDFHDEIDEIGRSTSPGLSSPSVGRKSLSAAPLGADELVPRPFCSLGLWPQLCFSFLCGG